MEEIRITKNYRRITICLIFFTISVIGGFEAGAGEIVDRIVAVVNDDIISLFDLNRIFEPYAGQIRSQGYPDEKERKILFKVRKDLIEQLVEQKLTEQETSRMGISVREKEIDKALERLKESRSLTREALEKGLAAEGMTMEEFRNTWKIRILRDKLVKREVLSGIVVTTEDVNDYYDKNEPVYGTKTRYHLRTILVKAPRDSDQAENESARQRADMIREKLVSGEDFATLARQYSDALADDGGNLGLYLFEDVNPLLKKSLPEMNKGDFSPILETDMGYQIYYLEDIVVSVGKSIEEVRPEIEEDLYKSLVDEKMREWLEQLKQKSHIKIIH